MYFNTMPLRSGKEYLKPQLCVKCKKFYSHELFGYQCSGCSETEPNHPSTLGAPGLDEWVKQQTINESKPKYISIIAIAKRWNNHQLCMLLCALKKKGFLLSSNDALEIFKSSSESYTNARGHIVATHIADWWNIKTSTVGGKWPPYLACYYGNFDSPYLPRTLPPRPPNKMLNCTGLEIYHIIQQSADEMNIL